METFVNNESDCTINNKIFSKSGNFQPSDEIKTSYVFFSHFKSFFSQFAYFLPEIWSNVHLLKNLVASFNHTDWIEQLQHQNGTFIVCSRDKVNYPNIRFRARFFRD